MTTTQDLMARLESARKKVDELTRKRMRLSGELDGHKKRMEELESKCQAEYGCTITELPPIAAKLEADAETALAKAEGILKAT